MDLSTLRQKLCSLEYTDPWEFIADAYKIVENAWLYNKKTTTIYKQATRVSSVVLPRTRICAVHLLMLQIQTDSLSTVVPGEICPIMHISHAQRPALSVPVLIAHWRCMLSLGVAALEGIRMRIDM